MSGKCRARESWTDGLDYRRPSKCASAYLTPRAGLIEARGGGGLKRKMKKSRLKKEKKDPPCHKQRDGLHGAGTVHVPQRRAGTCPGTGPLPLRRHNGACPALTLKPSAMFPWSHHLEATAQVPNPVGQGSAVL
jgi:hypothetical protein